MKKFLIIILIILIYFNIYSIEKKPIEEKPKVFLKRTVAILPVLNQNKIEKYNYLADTIRDALKAKIMKNDNYIITVFSKIDDEIKKAKITIEEVLKDDNAKRIAYKSRSDIAIIGKYIILEDQIMINIEAIDVFTGQTVVLSRMTGELGLDLFTIVDEITADLYEKMAQKIKKVDRTYFTEMSKMLKDKYDKFALTNLNKMGIAFTASGSTLFIAGMIVLIYTCARYNDVVQYNKDYGPRTYTGYDTYTVSYWTFIGLLSGSVSFMATGAVLCSIGIPFIVYKKKNDKLSFNIDINDRIELSLNYKF